METAQVWHIIDFLEETALQVCINVLVCKKTARYDVGVDSELVELVPYSHELMIFKMLTTLDVGHCTLEQNSNMCNCIFYLIDI